MTHLKDRVNLIKREKNQNTKGQEKVGGVMQSFPLKKYQKNVATLPRFGRFVGAKVFLGAGAGLILGDPLKEVACTADSILDLCVDTSSLSEDVEDIHQTQKETMATLQGVQSAQDENVCLLGNEVRATQENVINLRKAAKDGLQTLDETFTLCHGEFTLYKECADKHVKNSLFLQELRYVISHLGTLLQSRKIVPGCVLRLQE